MATKVIEGVRRVSSLGGRVLSASSTMTLDDQDSGLRDAVATMTALHAGTTGDTYVLGDIHDAVDQSGFTFADSPAMDAVLSRIESGESAGIAFAYFDRNGRNWWAQGPFFSRLEKAGGEYVVRGMESIDYRDQVGRQLFGSMAVASEAPHFAAKVRGDNIAGELMNRKVPNRVPYGYQRNGTFVDGRLAQRMDETRDPKALVIADTGMVVENIYALRLLGYGVLAIAAALNDAGVPGPRGGRWVGSTMSSLIRNPIYKGTITLGRRKRDRSKGTNVRTAYDASIAIVSEPDWKRAQTGVSLQRNGTYRAGVAGGVLTCSGCGRTLSVVGSGERRMYGCRRGDSKGSCTAPVYVSKAPADAFVDDLVEAALANSASPLSAIDASRTLEAARAALEAATAEAEALTEKVPPSHARFAHYMAKADEAVAAAQADYDDAVERAGRVRNFPDANEYRAWSDDERNAVARDLLSVAVVPPLSRSKFAPITERFVPRYY